MTTLEIILTIICIILVVVIARERYNYRLLINAAKAVTEALNQGKEILDNKDAVIHSLKSILKTHNIDLGNLLENIEEKVLDKKKAELLIKECVIEALKGYQDWLKQETDIVEKGTKKVLSNAEINIRPDTQSMMKNYVYPRLAKLGVIWGNDNVLEREKV
jgi:hypothetical protein